METWSWSCSVQGPDGTDVSPRHWTGRKRRAGVKECSKEVESKVGRREQRRMKLRERMGKLGEKLVRVLRENCWGHDIC